MTPFRNDLGTALERVARLEDENNALRAELLRLSVRGAAPASSKKRRVAVPWDAGLLCLVLAAGVAAEIANLHFANLPLHIEGPAPTSVAAATPTDLALGCTTPFVYEVGGELRRACLSMPP